MKKLLSLCGFLVFLLSGAAFAQMAPSASEELALFESIPMVTTATHTAMKITSAPAAMSVITAQDIANSGYTNVWDLLRSQPGVSVFQTTGGYAAASTRGFNSSSPDKIQVLLDGRSIFDPLIQGNFWTENIILLEDIDRIEIMRGPNSVLYGFNAVNGVINIITKEASQTKGGLAKAIVGEAGTQQYFGRFSDKAGDLDYRISYEKYNSWGLGEESGKSYNDPFRLQTVNLRTKYHLSESQNLEFLSGIKGGPIGGQGIVGDGIVMDFENDYQQLKYNQKLSETNSFYVQFFRNNIVKDYNTTPANGGDIAFKQYDFEAQQSFQPWEKHHIVWGGGWRRNLNRISMFSDGTHYYPDTILRVFGQDAIDLTDKVTWYTGVDWAQNSFVGAKWSTRQTLMYALLENQTLRATYGRAHRAFGSITHINTRPSLNPESIDAYELGYRGMFLGNKLAANLELFYNDIDDIINGNGFTTPYNNGNSAIAKGIESSLEYKPVSWLKTYLNHTYLFVEDKLGAWDIRDPKHKINFGGLVTLNNKFLPDYIDTRVNYVSTYTIAGNFGVAGAKIPPYWKLDMKLAKRFFDNNMEVSVTGLNLLAPGHLEASNSLYVAKQILGAVKVQF
jgi:iron complex outermembrane recepter protein